MGGSVIKAFINVLFNKRTYHIEIVLTGNKWPGHQVHRYGRITLLIGRLFIRERIEREAQPFIKPNPSTADVVNGAFDFQDNIRAVDT